MESETLIESWVKAYVLVMVTAYRLIATLVYLLRKSGGNDPWETSQRILNALERVERMEITLGKECSI
jgi:hypothetical protein